MRKLAWDELDLSEKIITPVLRLTGASVQIPIHPDLYEYLLELLGSDGKGVLLITDPLGGNHWKRSYKA